MMQQPEITTDTMQEDVEWRFFISPSAAGVPEAIANFVRTADAHTVLNETEARTDVYVPATEAVGVKHRKTVKLEGERRTAVHQDDAVAGDFEGYVKVKLGKKEGLDTVAQYMQEHGHYTEHAGRCLSSVISVVVEKQVRKGTPPGHESITLEHTDVVVHCENAAASAQHPPSTLITFNVEGPKGAVTTFLKETEVGAVLRALCAA